MLFLNRCPLSTRTGQGNCGATSHPWSQGGPRRGLRCDSVPSSWDPPSFSPHSRPLGNHRLVSRLRAGTTTVLAFAWTCRRLLRSLRTGSCQSLSQLCPEAMEVRSRSPSEGVSQGMLRAGEGDTPIHVNSHSTTNCPWLPRDPRNWALAPCLLPTPSLPSRPVSASALGGGARETGRAARRCR